MFGAYRARMIVRSLIAAVVAALLVPSGAAEARAGASVTVANMAFTPASVSVALGESVTWTFQDSVPHTSTSDQGFWDSGSRSGGTSYVRRFTSAGTFAYHCSIHPMMHGVVRVPVGVTAPSEAKRVLRWSTGPAPAGTTFDVQVKAGSGPWSSFRTDTTRGRAAFKPADHDITYRVRARTTRSGADSGWSRPVTITFA